MRLEVARTGLGLRKEGGKAEQREVERKRDVGLLASLYHQGHGSYLMQTLSKNHI